jgi:hypothetical protein
VVQSPRALLTVTGSTVERAHRRAPYMIVASFVVLVLFATTVLSLVKPGSVTISHNQAVNVAIATASLLVAFGAAFFLVTDFLLYGKLTSFYLGYAFLVFGGASAGSGLLPLLLGWNRQMHFVPYGWALQRVVGAMFLFAGGLLVDLSLPAPLYHGASRRCYRWPHASSYSAPLSCSGAHPGMKSGLPGLYGSPSV